MKLEFNIRKLNNRDVAQIIQVSEECRLAEWTEAQIQSDRSFYRHKKFVETQACKDFYTNPTEAAVLMKLEIKKQETGRTRRLDS